MSLKSEQFFDNRGLFANSIYKKLKQELEEKQKSVEDTIKHAGEAYIQRNFAEEQLRDLQEKAEKQKREFEEECQKINESIKRDKKFKEFIKSKHNEREELENLEKSKEYTV